MEEYKPLRGRICDTLRCEAGHFRENPLQYVLSNYWDLGVSVFGGVKMAQHIDSISTHNINPVNMIEGFGAMLLGFSAPALTYLGKSAWEKIRGEEGVEEDDSVVCIRIFRNLSAYVAALSLNSQFNVNNPMFTVEEMFRREIISNVLYKGIGSLASAGAVVLELARKNPLEFLEVLSGRRAHEGLYDGRKGLEGKVAQE